MSALSPPNPPGAGNAGPCCVLFAAGPSIARPVWQKQCPDPSSVAIAGPAGLPSGDPITPPRWRRIEPGSAERAVGLPRRGKYWKSLRFSGGRESVRTGFGVPGDGSKGVPMQLGLEFQDFGNRCREAGHHVVVIVSDPRGIQHTGASRSPLRIGPFVADDKSGRDRGSI